MTFTEVCDVANRMQRAKEMDPNRFKVQKSIGNFPGLPNNPENNQQNTYVRASLSGYTENAYRDGKFVDPRFGHQAIPVPPSGLLQSTPFGQKLNGLSPFGMQPQPPLDGQIPDALAMANYLGSKNSQMARSIPSNEDQPMGSVGRRNMVAPGGSIPDSIANNRSLGLQGMQGTGDPASGMDTKSGQRNKKSDTQKA